MKVSTHAALSLWIATSLAMPIVYAAPVDPYSRNEEETNVDEKEARAWEIRPIKSRVFAFTTVKNTIHSSARLLTNLLVAPFRGMALVEDKYQVYGKVTEILYTDDHKMGVMPVSIYTSDIGFSAGASIFHKNLFGHDELLRLKGLYGGDDFYSIDLKSELPTLLDRHLYIKVRTRFESDPKRDFSGIGNPGSGLLEPSGRSRFREERFLLLGQTGWQFGSKRQFRVGVSFIYNQRDFSQDVAFGAPPIGELYDTSVLPGFDEGIDVFENSFDIALDLRDHAGTTSEGALLSAFAGRDVGGTWDFRHYGGEAIVYWTPWRERRVLIFRMAHEGVSGENIAFTELPRLGGAGRLRGYRDDSFRDELSSMGTIEYRYPVHNLISGSLFVDSGKVARTYDKLLGDGILDDWHFGYGGGLTFHTEDNLVVNLQIAVGDGVRFYLAADVLKAFRSRGRRL